MKKGKKGRTFADWLQQLILQPEQVRRLVIAELVTELVKLASRLKVGHVNMSFDLRDEDWLRQHRAQVEIYLVWLEVLQQLLGEVPLEEITLPETLPVPEVSKPKAPPGPWLEFGLTSARWLESIHDVLMRSAVAGSVAASNAISKAGIQTIGKFYELWQGADMNIYSSIPNFGEKRLRIVKQALKAAGIPLPVWSKISAAKMRDLTADRSRDDFTVTEAQWTTPLADILVHDSGGNTYQSVRVRNILAKAGCATVGELYLFCQGRKTALLTLNGMSETRLVILDQAMEAAGIPLLSQ